MNVLRRLKSRGRKSLFGCQWISKRETSISLNCFKYLNKLLYKTEDVSAGHVLTGTTVWSSLHGLLCRVLDILNELTFFKGVWLNDWILTDSLKHLKTWSNTGLNFFFSQWNWPPCPAFNYNVGIKDTSEPMFWFSVILKRIGDNYYEQSTCIETANQLQRKCHVMWRLHAVKMAVLGGCLDRSR